jgi:hypothetical protein
VNVARDRSHGAAFPQGDEAIHEVPALPGGLGWLRSGRLLAGRRGRLRRRRWSGENVLDLRPGGMHPPLGHQVPLRQPVAAGLGCPGVRVHAHIRERVAEARLHEATSRQVERLPGRAHHIVNDRRYRGLSQAT